MVLSDLLNNSDKNGFILPKRKYTVNKIANKTALKIFVAS